MTPTPVIREDRGDAPLARHSASLLLVRDDPFRVLLVLRSQHSTFPSALVFPGGAVETSDSDPMWDRLIEPGSAQTDRAARIAALRESWEETGIFTARQDDGRVVSPSHDAGATFLELVRASLGFLPLDEMVEFGHWITPSNLSRRFDTRFYLMVLPEGQVAAADGHETIEAIWSEPAEAVARGVRGQLPLLFPTLMNLSRLAESTNAADALAAARAREHFVVQPLIEERSDGTRWIVIPQHAGYSASEWPAGIG